MTSLDQFLKDVKAKLNAATPGPWKWVLDDDYSIDLTNGKQNILNIYESHGGGSKPKTEDANLIAEAPTDLARAIETLSKWNELLKEQCCCPKLWAGPGMPMCVYCDARSFANKIAEGK